MNDTDSVYQDAVDREIDRLARMSPIELMQLRPRHWTSATTAGPLELHCLIRDIGDVRDIAVMASRVGALGSTKRQFVSALRVRLSAERLADEEIHRLWD